MKKGKEMMKFFFISLMIAYQLTICAKHPVENVRQVVLWGHKLHSHTHSYIHWGFKRAFEHLGYKTLWLDNTDSTKNIDFSNSLFITEGQVDKNIPVLDDCFYIIHNCKPNKYQHLLNNGHAMILQVYSHDCLKRNEPTLDFCFHYDLNQPILYMPWATDLLPHEIDEIKRELKHVKKNRSIYFVGSIGDGVHGNKNQWNNFKRACQKENIPCDLKRGCTASMEQNILQVQNAYLAPAIQSQWQCENGYIPCRIFKNISYGAMGITNNKTVYELFDKKIVYNSDTYQLLYDAQEALDAFDLQKQCELMDFVRDKHTYLNRIERLFNFFEMVANNNFK